MHCFRRGRDHLDLLSSLPVGGFYVIREFFRFFFVLSSHRPAKHTAKGGSGRQTKTRTQIDTAGERKIDRDEGSS